MAFRHHSWPDHRLHLAAAYGTVSGSDIMSAMQAVFHDPAWQPGFNVLWDGRAIETLLLTPEDTERIARATQEMSEKMGDGRAAVVVLRFLDYAQARLFAARNNSTPGRDIRLFNNMAEAVQWLGVPPELVEGRADGPA